MIDYKKEQINTNHQMKVNKSSVTHVFHPLDACSNNWLMRCVVGFLVQLNSINKIPEQLKLSLLWEAKIFFPHH